MRIACLGWGSLIWDSRNLEIPKEAWAQDGPLLPIEFARISNNKRATLVIDKEAAPVRVLWAVLHQTDLAAAIKLLATREELPSTKKISNITSTDKYGEDDTKRTVLDWLKEHPNLDAAIWTGLSYKVPGIRPTVEEILSHLRSLTGNERMLAEQYVRNTPAQIDTEYRREIVRGLGWD